MKEKIVSAVSLVALVALGAVAVALAQLSTGSSYRFLLALYPLLVVLFGVALLRQSGLTMAFAGLILTVVFAVFLFQTPADVVFGASMVGFLKSFGISIS